MHYRQVGNTELRVSGAGPLAPELMARLEMVWRANSGCAGPPPAAGGG